jgi:peptide chain release factor subunit 1
MESERFRKLLDVPGPFASVYFDDSHDTHDAAAQLDLKWRAVREELERQHADEAVIGEIGTAVNDLRPPVGRSGRAVVASAGDVEINQHLALPTPATVVRVSELPYIVPILAQSFDHPDYVLVVVDHSGADITTHIGGKLRAEAVDGGGHPVHKAAGAENAGYGDAQIRTDEDARKNLRAVADRVSELVDNHDFDVIFVVGEVSSRSDLIAELPHRLRERTATLDIGARHSGHDFGEVERAIEAEFLKRQLRTIDDVAWRFTAEIGRQSGLAAEGLGGVCSALRQGAVETLIIGDLHDATVVSDEELTTVAENENVLSEQGAAAAKTLRADEALPMFATSIGAALVRTDERIAPVDGVGAVLRYAPTLHEPVG